jgi:hypothetical protein
VVVMLNIKPNFAQERGLSMLRLGWKAQLLHGLRANW